MTDPEIGARIARWRRRRGLSQVALAGLIGRSESWLSQVERGRRPVESLLVLRELARVLRVDLQVLAPTPTPTTTGPNRPVTAGLEQALLAPTPDGVARPVTARQVADLHAAYQDARYGDVLAHLPALATRLPITTDPRVLAPGWTVAAKTLTKIGADDLAHITADRAHQAATRTGDPADIGMAIYQLACAMLPTPRADIGEDLAVRTAHDLPQQHDHQPGRTDRGHGAAVRSVAGALWLLAAIAAARRSDADTAAHHLDHAERLAQTIGRDANLRWTAFGPTNVALHRVSVATELGDAPAAITAAQHLDPTRFPTPLRGRRVQVGLDLAWAYTRSRRDADAVLALLQVERAAPDTLRHTIAARTTITTLLTRARGTTATHLRALADRNHITP